jgi:pimeloyl-ACP methyl ester carboxylesterase
MCGRELRWARLLLTTMPQAARKQDGDDSPPLVCVHGLSGSSRWWTPVAALLKCNGPVVLLDVPRWLRPSQTPAWLAGRIEELGAPVDVAGHSLGARTMLGARPSFLLRLTLDGLRAGPLNLARGGLHVASADVTAELPEVTTPTLLVWGARDEVVPIEEASTWLERMPDVRLIVIPDAGHVPMVESPVELAEAIGGFLEERFDESRDDQGM